MNPLNRHGCWAIVGIGALIGACKPPEPTPSHYRDLGTDDAPLVPPPAAWHDPATAKGTAEWRPFRKPSPPEDRSAKAKPGTETKQPEAGDVEAEAEATGEGADAEKEIRGIVADFNAALADKKLDEASEFLTDAQAEKSGEVFAAVNALLEQLQLLQAAAPALADKINAALPALDLSESLKIEVQSIQVIDAKRATAKLTGGAEARLEVGDEDLWYLESPMLALLEKEQPRLEQASKDIQEALAKGTPDEAAATTLGTMLDELRTALTPKSAEAGGES